MPTLLWNNYGWRKMPFAFLTKNDWISTFLAPKKENSNARSAYSGKANPPIHRMHISRDNIAVHRTR
jgi:hypothetical protein